MGVKFLAEKRVAIMKKRVASIARFSDQVEVLNE
jgi:hypothetical protein